MQRLHENDMTGFLLNSDMGFRHFRLPKSLVGFKYRALWHIQNRLKHIRREIKNREKQGIFAKNGQFAQNLHNLR